MLYHAMSPTILLSRSDPMTNKKTSLTLLTRLSLECPSCSSEELAETFQSSVKSLGTYKRTLDYIERLRSSSSFRKRESLFRQGWQVDFYHQFINHNHQLDFSHPNLSTVSPNNLVSLYQNTGWLNLHPSRHIENIPGRPKRVTLITSMFRCADWLKICLDNITSQSAFSECEVLLFDCERNHELFIACYPYLVQHENIRYFRLKSDPGLYGVWNIGIQISEGCYIGNMNTDDLRSPYQIETLVCELESNLNVGIASTAIVPYQKEDVDYISSLGLSFAHSTTLWPKQDEAWFTYLQGCYTLNQLFKLDVSGKAIESQCIPHCAPLWKKSLHEALGFFNETFYSSAADWGFWCTVLSRGYQAFLSGQPYTYYFVNPSSYMRRDLAANEVTRKLCDAYNDKNVLRITEEGILRKCAISPSEIVDFLVNIP